MGDGNRLDVSGKVGVEPKTSYKYITGASGGKKVGRRTAAGVFFEMLQLKTWDYIHVVRMRRTAILPCRKQPSSTPTPRANRQKFHVRCILLFVVCLWRHIGEAEPI